MQLGSDGFKSLDTGEDTGFEKTDVVAKLEWTSTSGKHNRAVKGAQSGESSRETYLGLAEQDFASNPFRRYAASAKDLMITDHAHVVVGHEFNPTARWSMTTEGYQTWFGRNWYKLDRVVDSTGAKLALGDILTDPSMTEALGWLQGASTPSGAGLDVKANNRQYGARGVQHRGRWTFGGDQQHRLTYGLRAHEDFMDRFQWRDRYAMVDGQMALVAAGDSARRATASSRHVRLLGTCVRRFTWALGPSPRACATNAWRCRDKTLERIWSGWVKAPNAPTTWTCGCPDWGFTWTSCPTCGRRLQGCTVGLCLRGLLRTRSQSSATTSKWDRAGVLAC